MAEFGVVETRTLFAGTEIPAMTSSVTVAGGQGVLQVGAVLGKVTAEADPNVGKYRLVSATSTDGSEVASVVLAEEIDTTDGDKKAVVFTSGLFNYDSLYVADGDDVKAHQEELRAGNIYFKTDY